MREQARGYLKRQGTATAQEICSAIAKNAKSARVIRPSLTAALHEMLRSGDLLSDGEGRDRLYSVEKRRHKGMRPSHAIAQSMARDPRVLDELRALAAQVHADIRAEALSEAYFRIAEGACRQQLADLMTDCVKWVRAESGAGGYKERASIDAALGDADVSLLDLIGDEDGEPLSGRLYIIEERVDTINEMLRDGYDSGQVAHLWNTAGTSWMRRRVK